MGSNEAKGSRKKVKKRRNSNTTKAIIAPARKIAIQILEDRVKSQKSREQLADDLDKTLGAINAIFYEYKGSFELIMAALIVSYELDETSLGDLGIKIRALLRKQTPSAQLDNAWYELDKHYTYQEKKSWLAAMQTYARTMKRSSDLK